MRGTPLPSFRRCNHRRIIPADAGNTAVAVPQFAGVRDHPRGCGEHTADHPMDNDLQGSSPRMRGTLVADPRRSGIWRIIPADAGNTRLHGPVAGRLPGSSPRMRGTPTRMNNEQNRPRIIPADAGNTMDDKDTVSDARDHPRGCGEHYPGVIMGFEPGGSSPRMRGTHPGLLAVAC